MMSDCSIKSAKAVADSLGPVRPDHCPEPVGGLAGNKISRCLDSAP